MALASHSWPWRETSRIICSSTKSAETVPVFRNWILQGLRYLWWFRLHMRSRLYDVLSWAHCPGCDGLWDCLPAICRSWADLPQMLEPRENSRAAEEVLKWSDHNWPANIPLQEYEGFPTSPFWQTDPWPTGGLLSAFPSTVIFMYIVERKTKFKL